MQDPNQNEQPQVLDIPQPSGQEVPQPVPAMEQPAPAKKLGFSQKDIILGASALFLVFTIIVSLNVMNGTAKIQAPQMFPVSGEEATPSAEPEFDMGSTDPTPTPDPADLPQPDDQAAADIDAQDQDEIAGFDQDPNALPIEEEYNIDLDAIGTQNQAAGSYTPSNPIYGDGSESAPYIVNDSSDQYWQKFNPQSLQEQYDRDAQTLKVSWNDNEQTIVPYMWMIEYSYEGFDPVEKFNLDNLDPNDFINYVNYINQGSSNINPKQFDLDVEFYDQIGGEVYYNIIIRTKIGDKYVDYLYNQDKQNYKYQIQGI